MRRKVAGRRLADKPYAQCVEHTCKRNFARTEKAFHNVGRRLLAQPGQHRHLFRLQVIQVGHIPNHPFRIEKCGGLLANSLDIHRLAGDEMYDTSDYLGRTAAAVGTVPGRFAFVPYELRSALRTVCDELERFAVRSSHRLLDTGYLGDDFPPFLHIDHIVEAHIEQRYLVGIVKGRPFHRRTGKLYRLEVRHRRDSPRTPYRKLDRHQTGECLLSLELVGYGPSGCLGCRAETTLQVVTVDLDYRTVRIVRQVRPQSVGIVYETDNLLPGTAQPHVVRNTESPLPSLVQILPMRFIRQSFACHGIQETLQTPRCNHRGVLQFQRPGRRIARIGERLLPYLLLLPVQGGKHRTGHIYLPPHLEIPGPVVSGEYQRNTAYGTHVGRHIVTHRTVTARHGTDQPALLVSE